MKTRNRIMIVRERGRTSIQIPIMPNRPFDSFWIEAYKTYAAMLPRTGTFTTHELLERVRLQAPTPPGTERNRFLNMLGYVERADWNCPGHPDADKRGVFRGKPPLWEIRNHLIYAETSIEEWKERIGMFDWNIHEVINFRYARSIA